MVWSRLTRAGVLKSAAEADIGSDNSSSGALGRRTLRGGSARGARGSGEKIMSAHVEIHRANAATLSFPDKTFDLVFQATVFTSFDADLKQRVAAEMRRVVKSEGLILWYDYHVNNPWNKDVRAVKRKEIYQLFPNCRIDLKRITLAPPLARALAPYSS